MINRKTAPAVSEIENVVHLLPEKWQLSNGIKVWGINAGSQEIVKIDFIFEAGAWYQTENLIAGLTNSFMNQGSKNYTAQEIAEAFDYRGAYLQLTVDQQFGTITIFTLNKYIEIVLKITADVIQFPVFPQKEIEAQIGKKKQQFIIENNKVKTISQKKFSQVIFGEDHQYSNTNKFEDYDKLTREKFIEFHAQNYTANKCKIVVAGRYDDNIKQMLNSYFGGENWISDKEMPHVIHPITGAKTKTHFVEKADALQSAIRIGCLFPNRDHIDFHGLNVLITLLGGYFGSRLMTNIREDKGYTYGIGAGIYSLPHASYLSIMTEVGSDVCDVAIKEIYFEIERLQRELIGEDELSIVRNYLLGETLRNFDGVFAMSGSLITLIESGLDYSHYDQFVEVLRNISPLELQQLAIKYLNVNELYQIVAGKK